MYVCMYMYIHVCVLRKYVRTYVRTYFFEFEWEFGWEYVRTNYYQFIQWVCGVFFQISPKANENSYQKVHTSIEIP